MYEKIAVFCSASNIIDPAYNKVARDFVRAASLRGYTIVSGGTVRGTMGEIDEELSECMKQLSKLNQVKLALSKQSQRLIL